MHKISVRKVENPSCLWARIIKDPWAEAETPKAYEDLQVSMNLFYHDVNLDADKLKLPSLEQGQICVVFWTVLKSWCRAVVEYVIQQSLVHCLLVDHGERLIVRSDQIRAAVQGFLQLPFWARRFRLAGIEPTTLRVSISEEKAELIPSSQWDSSATRYLHNLLKASTQNEVALLVQEEQQAGSTAIQLYVTIDNIKICVNDDFVAKRFAFYSQESIGVEKPAKVLDHFLPVLACDIYTDTKTFLASNGCSVRTLRPFTAPQTTTKTTFKTPSQTTANSSQIRPLADPLSLMNNKQGPPQRLNNSSEPEMSQHRHLDLSERSQVNKLQSPGNKETSKAHPAGRESEGQKETDSSLFADLTSSLNLFRLLKFMNPLATPQNVNLSRNDTEPGCITKTVETGPDGDLGGLDQDRVEIISGNTALRNGPARAEGEVGDQVETALDRDTMDMPVTGIDGEPAGGPAGHTGQKETQAWTSRPEDQACARLLQWLNPDPDATHEGPVDPSQDGVLLHSVLPVEPCSSLADAPITEPLRRALSRQSLALCVSDCYVWPAVSRGCDAVIVSSSADQPLCYLPPLLTHLLLSSLPTAPTARTGPIAVILCPGWEKVQQVLDLLDDSQVCQSLRPLSVVLGVGKDEAKTAKIPKNCQLLVTTPFTLDRLLSIHCFLFLRLCLLVLDQADQLFSLAPDQMVSILQHFQKVTSADEWTCSPRQIVAVGKCWSDHMESLLDNHMSSPCVVITLPEEAALYAGVHQTVLLALESTKISVMLSALDFTPDSGQKTLIITNSAEEVEHVFKAVSNTSALCLKTHQGLSHQFEEVVHQWRRDTCAGTHVIMITTDECLKPLGIRDASCIVHYSFPGSPRLFGRRLFCMVHNFRNIPFKGSSSTQQVRSLLLVSEKNARHVVGLLRYLRRTDALLPPELLSFAEGVLAAREEAKISRPLCSNLKCLGVCRDSSACPDRHRLNSELDESFLPDSGVVTVLPLYIKTASMYYGRLVKRLDGAYERLAAEMEMHYGQESLTARDVQEGALYGVQEDEKYHRVRVVHVPEPGECVFFSVEVLFIDEGRQQEVRAHQLLLLPSCFHLLPPQALEMVVCRLQPADGETQWNPKVTRSISHKIRGVEHQARVLLSLGNTIFLDPMVKVTRVPGMKTLINDHNVRTEILNSGMGIGNPQHLELLKALQQGGGASDSQVANHISGFQASGSLEAVEDTLSLSLRTAALQQVSTDVPAVTNLASVPPAVEDASPAGDIQEVTGEKTEVTAGPEKASATWRSFSSLCMTGDISGLSPKDWLAAQLSRDGYHGDESHANGQQDIITDELDITKRLHPQVTWYQKREIVMVTVKLIYPQDQTCKFSHDHVNYRGSVCGRLYAVDLRLYGSVCAERCSWEMRCNEPVLRLVKEQAVAWPRLLEHKNNLVTYDLDHYEEEEEIPNGFGDWGSPLTHISKLTSGLGFFGDTGEDSYYVDSPSGSESD